MKRKPLTRQWPLRLTFVSLGAGAAALGLAAWRAGYLWEIHYSANLGRVVMGPTLGWVMLGVFFIILGIIPWPKDRRSRKEDYKWKTHL